MHTSSPPSTARARAHAYKATSGTEVITARAHTGAHKATADTEVSTADSADVSTAHPHAHTCAHTQGYR